MFNRSCLTLIFLAVIAGCADGVGPEGLACRGWKPNELEADVDSWQEVGVWLLSDPDEETTFAQTSELGWVRGVNVTDWERAVRVEALTEGFQVEPGDTLRYTLAFTLSDVLCEDVTLLVIG